MSITTISLSGNDYISYASLAEANARLLVDPVRNTAWTALDDTQKQIRLVAATNRLDLFSYTGEKTGGDTQPNQWPRTNATCNGDVIATTTDVPLEIQDATILLAGTIATNANAANAGSSGSNIKEVQAGSARVEFFSPQSGVGLQDETAYNLIACLLASVGVGFGAATGTTGTTAFEDRDAPQLDEGYP